MNVVASPFWHVACIVGDMPRGYNQGGDHALDDIRSTSSFVGARFCQRLRHWWIHSPTLGNRRGGIVDSVDSRAQLDLRRSSGLGVTIRIA